MTLAEQGVEQAAARGPQRALALVVAELSEAYLLAGRLEEARQRAEQAYDLARQYQQRGIQAWTLRLLGDIAARCGPSDIEQVETYYRQALTLAEALGMRPLVAHCYCGLGTLYATIIRREQAHAELLTAIALYRAMQMTFWLSLAEAALAEVERRRSRGLAVQIACGGRRRLQWGDLKEVRWLPLSHCPQDFRLTRPIGIRPRWSCARWSSICSPSSPGRGRPGAVCPDGLHADPGERDTCRYDPPPARRRAGVAAAQAGHLVHRPSRPRVGAAASSRKGISVRVALCDAANTLFREGVPMASPQRILVLGTSHGGGNWPPLAAVIVSLHQAGHAVQCFGDPAIAHDLAAAAVAVEVVSAEDPLSTFIARWRAAGDAGPSPFRAWADACVPAVRALVREFRPRLVLSELFTMELARLTKAASGLPWCCLNPGYYFGPESTRPFEADFVGRTRYYIQQFLQELGEADLVLHATDPLFDPPPPSLPRHHHYVGPLWWERPSETPPYLDVPGAPWVLVTVSSNPQAGEMTLARTALQTLAAHPVRVVLTLSPRHPRDEPGGIPANARIEQFVPHSAVLKRSGLLVSHAGHGIVAKALYYSVPMVLVPWDRDQPGVAARAAALGVAEVIPRHDLTALRLSTAIDRVLGNPRYQEHAARIASHLQTRDAVAMARARIEELLEAT